MRFSFFALAAVVAAVPAQALVAAVLPVEDVAAVPVEDVVPAVPAEDVVPAAPGLVAYNNERCEGTPLNVTLDGRCYDNFNALSFTPATVACLRVFSHNGCQETGQRFTYDYLSADVCKVTNHGMNTHAFRAWAGPECPPHFND